MHLLFFRTYSLFYRTYSMGHRPSTETNSLPASKKIPGCYCSRNFITAQNSLSCVPLRSQPSNPTATSILKLKCLLRLVLTGGLFLSTFLTKSTHLFLLHSQTSHMPPVSHPPDLIIQTIFSETHEKRSPPFCSFPHRCLTSCF